MADTSWQLRVRQNLELCSKLVYGVFWHFWSRCSNHTYQIVNDGSNMAVKNSEKTLIFYWNSSTGVFGVADKILRHPGFEVMVKVWGNLWFSSKLIQSGFRSQRLRFCYWTFEIQNGGYIMVIKSKTKS